MDFWTIELVKIEFSKFAGPKIHVNWKKKVRQSTQKYAGPQVRRSGSSPVGHFLPFFTKNGHANEKKIEGLLNPPQMTKIQWIFGPLNLNKNHVNWKKKFAGPPDRRTFGSEECQTRTQRSNHRKFAGRHPTSELLGLTDAKPASGLQLPEETQNSGLATHQGFCLYTHHTHSSGIKLGLNHSFSLVMIFAINFGFQNVQKKQNLITLYPLNSGIKLDSFYKIANFL